MEIGKFEYCNPLHKPVMSLLHYLGTYLSFIMYSERDGLSDRWYELSVSESMFFESTTSLRYDNHINGTLGD